MGAAAPQSAHVTQRTIERGWGGWGRPLERRIEAVLPSRLPGCCLTSSLRCHTRISCTNLEATSKSPYGTTRVSSHFHLHVREMKLADVCIHKRSTQLLLRMLDKVQMLGTGHQARRTDRYHCLSRGTDQSCPTECPGAPPRLRFAQSSRRKASAREPKRPACHVAHTMDSHISISHTRGPLSVPSPNTWDRRSKLPDLPDPIYPGHSVGL